MASIQRKDRRVRIVSGAREVRWGGEDEGSVVAGKSFGDYALSRSGPAFKQTFSGGCSNVKLFKQKLKKDRCFYIVIFLY